MVKLVLDSVDFGIPSSISVEGFEGGIGECLSETDLHYTLFVAEVTVEIGGTVVIGPRRRVPIFDFLACIARSLASLRESRPASMGFTEAADRVYFRPVADGSIEVSTSEVDWTIYVNRERLISAFAEFLAAGYRQLIDNVPGIQRNPHISKLLV